MYIDEKEKRIFRVEKCNIVEMTKDKVAIIPKGDKILKELQSQEEFEKLLHVKNWAVTQTNESSILFFDSDPKNPKDFNEILKPLFNRRRDKYIEHSLQVNSQHGFIEVTDVTHEKCVIFAKMFHSKSGIEIYAESHWMIFGGTYYNNKNIDDPKRETTWYKKDDLHNEPIINVTKNDLYIIFSKISKPLLNDELIQAGSGERHIALISLGFKEAKTLIRKNEPLNFNSLYLKLINTEIIDRMSDYEKGNNNYQELQNIIEFVINHVESDISFGQDYIQSKNENRFAHILENSVNDQFNAWYWDSNKWSENTAHYILEKLLPLKSEEFKPNSGMALKISNNISASDLTLKVDMESHEYVKEMMEIMTNTYGQYYNFKSGGIKNVDPSIMFYKNSQLKIKFDSEIDKPVKFLEFVKERFQDGDREILLDHLAGSLLHTTVLGSKPKIGSVVS
ncbi:MAG: hypothetical protein HRU07_06795 [Nitrosopumilus sp.]|nr:hypothetical protein [Nitrosopumilus sp.]NRA05846.1 hypothetical protein [Nitrosopumilus sp.]